MIRVIHAVSIMNRAGQETFLMNVYRTIDKDKIQFDFQCSIPGIGDYDDEVRELGGHLIYLGENIIKIPYLRYIGDVILQYKFFKNHKEYDIFHIHTYHAFNAFLTILGAKLGGMQHIVLHSHNSHALHPMLHRIFRKVLGRMKITRYACSEKAAKWMYGEKAVAKQNVKVVKNGIFPETFSFSVEGRNLLRKHLGIEDNIVIGHIGRFEHQKNHDFLVRVFSAFLKIEPKAKLLLIGTGSLRQKIENEVQQLGISGKVLFLGVRKDISQLLWGMDAFLFPSFYEGLSVVAIEAQAAGVPILASDKISEETKIAECISFYPLEKSADEWAGKLYDICRIGHKNTLLDIKRAGYDIHDTSSFMASDYIRIIKKN